MSNETGRNARGRKVTIVGVGNVGATTAYALMLSGLCSELVLIDSNAARAEGEAMDLSQAVPFCMPVRVRAGTFADSHGSHVTVIAAGANQRPGETRLELLARNWAIFRNIIPQLIEANRDGVIVVATNPVDVLTYGTWGISGLPRGRVIGTGTILDTARFRALLG
ncbi:MAG: L-lactate dehydrogenase, partial [Chloroflexi bacterium]|nr:L-lactate dehydrogenase [Chloroflexota bacterium]